MIKFLCLLIISLSFNLHAEIERHEDKHADEDIYGSMCPKEKYGHTAIIIDTTGPLTDAQFTYMMNMVFDDSKIDDIPPYDRISLLNMAGLDFQASETNYIFSKCRPRNGNKSSIHKLDHPTFFGVPTSVLKKNTSMFQARLEDSLESLLYQEVDGNETTSTAVSSSTTIPFATAINSSISVGDEVFGTNLTTNPTVSSIAENKLSIVVSAAVTLDATTNLKFKVEKKMGEYTQLIEQLKELSRLPNLKFDDSYKYRELIIVSDLVQYSKRLNLYPSCRNNKKCITWDEFKNKQENKLWIKGIMPKFGKNNPTVKIIYLNSKIDPMLNIGLLEFWDDYFSDLGIDFDYESETSEFKT